MIEFIILFLGVSLFLYAFLAGADFGAGIIQILPTKVGREEKVRFIGKAVGPVWEANHIWLILALTITFNAFPDIFWFLSEWFHFPLGALVAGIIFRGASFTFLHYDPIQDKSQKVYHWIFGLSSVWCSFWIGVIVGALMLGEFSLQDENVFDRYFGHWLNTFCLMSGLFTTLLMMFNASLFLTAEAKENENDWKKLTTKIFFTLVIVGLLTHIVFLMHSPERWKLFFLHPISMGLIILSVILLYPQIYTIQHHFRNLSRIIAAVQLLCILCAGFAPLYPRIIVFRDFTALDVYATAAAPSVLRPLVYALIFGSLFILPSYVFLMRIFKRR